jgi:hypothetical protein
MTAFWDRTRLKVARIQGFILGDFDDQINFHLQAMKAERRAAPGNSRVGARQYPRLAPSTDPFESSPADGSDPNEAAPGEGETVHEEDEASPDPSNEAGDDRDEVTITTDEYQVNNQAVAALRKAPNLFVRGPMLVKVIREPEMKFKKGQIQRKAGTPRIHQVTSGFLRELSTRYIRWQSEDLIEDEYGGAELKIIPQHPPKWSIDSIIDRGEWTELRPIMGVVEAPVLRPDGTILQTPGWDKDTGLYYQPSCDFLPLAERPTLDDAKEAVKKLYDIVQDFPFAEILTKDGKALSEDDKSDDPRVIPDEGRTHRAAWLAALLTPLGRHAIDGPTPVFRLDANTAGSGKSKLTDIIAILATGREMARMAFPARIEEQEKSYMSVALAGDPMILWDNVANGSSLGGSMFDMSTTATIIKGRVLGVSSTPELPWYTVQYATGNNLSAAGDGLRRICPIRLNSPEERPEERTGFAIPNLIIHVKEHRAELVHAALTILRAFVVAGMPKPAVKLTPMDFVEWCDLIRFAVYWATDSDPCGTRAEMIASDDGFNDRTALIEGFAELPGSDTGLTAANILRILVVTSGS